MSVCVPAGRAFTLIEMLAAIAVLVVLSAIAMPVIAGRVAGARFEAAARQVESMVVLSRAEAQRRGEALSLIVERGSGITRFLLEPWSATDGAKQEEGERTRALLGELAEGISVSGHAPVDMAGSSEVGNAQTPLAEAGEARLVVATFLPDGTAAVRGPAYITDRGRTVVVKLNSWTGAAAVEEYVPPTESDQGQEDRATKSGPDGAEEPKEM